jgi:hypothetical protein
LRKLLFIYSQRHLCTDVFEHTLPVDVGLFKKNKPAAFDTRPGRIDFLVNFLSNLVARSTHPPAEYHCLIVCRIRSPVPIAELLDHLLVPNAPLPSPVAAARPPEVPETHQSNPRLAEALGRNRGRRGAVAEHPVRPPEQTVHQEVEAAAEEAQQVSESICAIGDCLFCLCPGRKLARTPVCWIRT